MRLGCFTTRLSCRALFRCCVLALLSLRTCFCAVRLAVRAMGPCSSDFLLALGKALRAARITPSMRSRDMFPRDF